MRKIEKVLGPTRDIPAPDVNTDAHREVLARSEQDTVPLRVADLEVVLEAARLRGYI